MRAKDISTKFAPEKMMVGTFEEKQQHFVFVQHVKILQNTLVDSKRTFTYNAQPVQRWAWILMLARCAPRLLSDRLMALYRRFLLLNIGERRLTIYAIVLTGGEEAMTRAFMHVSDSARTEHTLLFAQRPGCGARILILLRCAFASPTGRSSTRTCARFAAK